MNLLLRREQTRGVFGLSALPFGFGAPKFKLWAKIELNPEERSVLDHYRFDSSLIIESVQPELPKNTAIVFGIALIACFAFVWPRFDLTFSIPIAVLIAGAIAFLYYDSKRETIYVRDLLYGRHFKCKSVIELARKEAWLEVVVSFLRQVMQSAKHWDGTEKIKIDELAPELAKEVILKGL